MTEAEAEAQVCDTVPRETADRLRLYVRLLRGEAERQNLISRSTLDGIWARHILDSAQLLPLAADTSGLWLDIGSGAGLPGIVVALLRAEPCLLVEPRTKRAAFLDDIVGGLGLAGHTKVIGQTAASAPPAEAAIISARAVAALPELFKMGQRFSSNGTLWLLPKGRSAAAELAAARASWQGDFRLVPSRTDSDASIVMARGVSPRKAR